jgi:hypothetical protein
MMFSLSSFYRRQMKEVMRHEDAVANGNQGINVVEIGVLLIQEIEHAPLRNSRRCHR